ncbi:MAG: homoprotocatechuate degradation operon regulator HpaR [Hyphomicrobiales bacterium]
MSRAKLASGIVRLRPFDRSLPMQLMRAREAVMTRFRPHLTARGLTEQQWRIIRALNEIDSLEIVDLGARCCIHPASLSRMLPKLAKAGLIARRTNAKDQRRIIVSLSARGRQLFAALAPQSEEIYAGLARDLGPARIAELYRVLGEMIDALAPNGRPGNTSGA